MLLVLGIIIIVASLIAVFVGVWKKRISPSMVLALMFVGIVVGVVVANLNDVVGLVIKYGDKDAYSLQLQRVENAAQKAETSATQAETDANAIREIKGRVEEVVKRLERGEQTASQMGSAIRDTDKILKGVQQQQAPRRLSDEQKRILVEALSPFRGQKVLLQCVFGDGDSCTFAKDFAGVFKEAGWDLGGTHEVKKAMYSEDPIGVEIHVNEGEADAGRAPQGFNALGETLFKVGLLGKKIFIKNPKLAVDEIQVTIGRKPSLP